MSFIHSSFSRSGGWPLKYVGLRSESFRTYQIHLIWQFSAFSLSALCFMKGVHRKGHQRASCLLCRSVLYSLIMSSLQSYYCTSWLHLSFALSLGLSTLFSLVGGLLREPQPPAAVTLLSLYRFLCFTLSWVPLCPLEAY